MIHSYVIYAHALFNPAYPAFRSFSSFVMALSSRLKATHCLYRALEALNGPKQEHLQPHLPAIIRRISFGSTLVRMNFSGFNFSFLAVAALSRAPGLGAGGAGASSSLRQDTLGRGIAKARLKKKRQLYK